jgi:HTH-type transcriptional regulator/antitoxin HipB
MPRLATPLQTAQILVSRRKAKALSQATLAASLGISQNRFSELETHPDKLTLDRLISLAGLLGLELVLQEKPPPSQQSEW